MTDQMLVSDIAAKPVPLAVRKITPADLIDALKRGAADFWATPTQLVFLSIIYPIVGMILARAAFGYDMLSLLYPLATGFALIGPFAALGMYELSRRREKGESVSWANAFDVFHSPSIYQIALLGLFLLAIFTTWMVSAQSIYELIFGVETPPSISVFLHQVIGTPAGWSLFFVGTGLGFLFAVVVLTLTVISFPLLLDRHVGMVVAIGTSVKAVLANPVTMAIWGLIVAGSLLIGCLPLFLGLAFVLPVLGHATWHLYRKVVVD